MHFPFFDSSCDLCEINCEEKNEEEKNSSNFFLYDEEVELDTDTIIIGNGPAGISLSSMLSGWHPFYNNSNPHPNPNIHELFFNKNQSLLFQDLTSAANLINLIEQNISSSTSLFGNLYDSLVRPSYLFNNDNQINNKNNLSSILWRFNSFNIIPHIVLGDTPIGGSWTGFDDEITAVSINNWMDLPGYSIANDFLNDPNLNNSRPTAKTFRNYLSNYCNIMGILKYFWQNTKVLQIKKIQNKLNSSYWEVYGINTISNENFTLKCKNVVLACGKNRQRRLEFPNDLKSIVYDLNSLKFCISTNTKNYPIIIVGDGISAADAIICALEKNCQVIHLIKRNDKQLKNIMLSRLSQLIYPEYSRVYKLMTGQIIEKNYKRLIETTILSAYDHLIELNTPNGIIKEKYSCLSICIGRQTEFPLIKGLNIDNIFDQFSIKNYCSIYDTTLYAIGAMIGDHFVRYLIGGSLYVANSIILKNNNNNFKLIRQPFKVLFNKNEILNKEEKNYKKIRRHNSKEKLKFLRTNSAAASLSQLA